MKGILKNWHRYLLWLVVSFFLWAWIFTMITDAPAAKKLVLYADCPAMEREALDAELEKGMPDHIRFVEARIFSDEMFQPSNLTSGDVFILSSQQIDRYLPGCISLPEAVFPGLPLFETEGKPYGVCVCDETKGIAVGTRYVAYLPGETYYLFFNAASRHLGDWNGSPDDAAIIAAREFLALP